MDLPVGHPVRKTVEDHAHRYPRCPNTRLPLADRRIGHHERQKILDHASSMPADGGTGPPTA